MAYVEEEYIPQNQDALYQTEGVACPPQEYADTRKRQTILDFGFWILDSPHA
ncbi:MAG: hypothetical protein HWQ23_00245 [Nostoc sp. JL33]|uniref:hypothetical protein n=1 Tax=Nostoc sp. JL33 TaxID=2815396 RepID=UPI0025DCA4A5|nr:hypothetical protein [Nostoc sp. JL33]MBN3868805.1 hypothetical protein [Nostoc sp. JL33]